MARDRTRRPSGNVGVEDRDERHHAPPAARSAIGCGRRGIATHGELHEYGSRPADSAGSSGGPAIRGLPRLDDVDGRRHGCPRSRRNSSRGVRHG